MELNQDALRDYIRSREPENEGAAHIAAIFGYDALTPQELRRHALNEGVDVGPKADSVEDDEIVKALEDKKEYDEKQAQATQDVLAGAVEKTSGGKSTTRPRAESSKKTVARKATGGRR